MVGGALRKALFGSPNFLIDSEMICYIFCGRLYKFCKQCKDILRRSWEKEGLRSGAIDAIGMDG